MIPSEFNQDIIAQRRKLRMLNEATEGGISIVAANNKTGEVILRVPDGQPSMMSSRLALLAKGEPGGVFKAEKKGRNNPRGDLFSFKVARFSNPSDVGKLLRQRLKGHFKESVELTERDATLEQGLTLSKRKAGGGTWIKVERISGKTYGVFRSFNKMKKIGKRPSTSFSVPDEDAFAGPGSDRWAYHKDRASALKLAQEISEKTGERVMIEDHKGRNVKFKLAFAGQQDGNVFMSKFSFSGLFGGGRLGKDLAPAGRAFTRITLKKSPFFGSEAYEQNVEVFPERMKAFLWQLADMGGAVITDRDKK